MIDPTEHMEYVKALAWGIHRKHHYRTDLDDLIGDGMIGLLRACEAYQDTLGVTFTVYAYSRIRGEMADGMRRMDMRNREDRRDNAPIQMCGIDAPLTSNSVDSHPLTLADILPAPQTDPTEAILLQELFALCDDRQKFTLQMMLDGYLSSEIAAEYGSTTGTWQQRRFHALRELRETVAALGNDNQHCRK